jgi:hypothetical protein
MAGSPTRCFGVAECEYGSLCEMGESEEVSGGEVVQNEVTNKYCPAAER